VIKKKKLSFFKQLVALPISNEEGLSSNAAENADTNGYHVYMPKPNMYIDRHCQILCSGGGQNRVS
jgi:hypothetical protein